MDIAEGLSVTGLNIQRTLVFRREKTDVSVLTGAGIIVSCSWSYQVYLVAAIVLGHYCVGKEPHILLKSK